MWNFFRKKCFASVKINDLINNTFADAVPYRLFVITSL